MPRKIAIDIRSIFGSRAGKGQYTYSILKNLLALDQKNQYLLYSDQPCKFSFCRRPNVKIRIIRGKSFFWHFFAWLDLKIITKPDYYLAPSSYIVPALGVKSAILIVPDLVAFLFPRAHYQKAVFLEKLFLKLALARASKIIAISESTKNDLISLFNLNPANIKVVYLASEAAVNISNEFIREVRSKYHLPSHFILSVGTLEPRKNLIRLIQAFNKVIDPDCFLVIVGKKGWYYQEIFKEVKRLNLEKKVIFLFYVARRDLYALYKLAFCFVYPSLYEGFGLPPLEGMAYGTPVIASNTSSLPEVVGQAALLVNPSKTKEITKAINLILTNSAIRSKLINQGLIQAKKFNWEKTAREILKLFS